VNSTLAIHNDPAAIATYAYSYPHKTSYRPLTPPVSIAEAWRDEDVQKLSLYAHVPFCEMRCGFCNLFTQSQPSERVVDAYLATLKRQMAVIHSSIPEARFGQFAVGGGTPTFLTARQLELMLQDVETAFSVSIRNLPTSVETSPSTATNDRLRLLSDFGVERISLGVQSFADDESHHIGRPQQIAAVHAALDSIRECGFPVLNIDLIYGFDGQSRESWLTSLRQALRYRPEELYLYPLYVRPETGLARTAIGFARHRSDLYRAARDLLGERGYAQSSLRCFRLPHNTSPSTYACQRDGMIGLGCGARSYTHRIHYATRFAVSQAGIRAILSEWIALSNRELSVATHGILLSDDEQRRRYVIMSLLQADGYCLADYQALFNSSPCADIPELEFLFDRGWLVQTSERLVLTISGLEHSDEAGLLLYSAAVSSRLREFTQL
jgi:oxygen-independent coproporphyrinogen-3 oxidase